MPDELAAQFEASRAQLVGLAYRMTGDVGRSEDIVQEAWLRVAGAGADIRAPQRYFAKIVARLCLNELDSARCRRELSRSDRLPEPVSLDDASLAVETLERVSMAFVVLLQRLTPGQRAVLLLHQVFDLEHGEIAELLGTSAPACRQALKRAREHIARAERTLKVTPDEHARLLDAFVAATSSGDVQRVANLLADDVGLVADVGPAGGRFGRARNLPGPLHGRDKVAAFLAAVTPQGAAGASTRRTILNGQPALEVRHGGVVTAAILLAVADGAIAGIFIHADPSRLSHLTGD